MTNSYQYPASRLATKSLTATIPETSTTSNAIDVRGRERFQFIFPATTDGASISFLVSDTLSGTYVPLHDESGNPLSFTITNSAGVALTNNALSRGLATVAFLKLVSDQTESGERTITVVVS